MKSLLHPTHKLTLQVEKNTHLSPSRDRATYVTYTLHLFFLFVDSVVMMNLVLFWINALCDVVIYCY